VNRRGHERAAHGGAGRHADKRNEWVETFPGTSRSGAAWDRRSWGDGTGHGSEPTCPHKHKHHPLFLPRKGCSKWKRSEVFVSFYVPNSNSGLSQHGHGGRDLQYAWNVCGCHVDTGWNRTRRHMISIHARARTLTVHMVRKKRDLTNLPWSLQPQAVRNTVPCKYTICLWIRGNWSFHHTSLTVFHKSPYGRIFYGFHRLVV
jgi:hypothetical protein